MSPIKPLRMGQQVRVGLVRDLKTTLSGVDTLVVAKVDRVATRNLNQLRRALSLEQASFLMVKNSLCKVAFKDLGWVDLGKTLEGTCGVSSIQGDVSKISRLLAGFSKDHEGFVLKGGILKGQFLDTQEWLLLGRLPSREVLLSQCAGILQLPIRNLAMVLQGPVRALALALAALKQKRESSQQA